MNGNKATVVQMIIQGGAVGIAILSVWFGFKLASNHIQHNTEILTKVYQASEAQVDATTELSGVIRDLDNTIKFNLKP